MKAKIAIAIFVVLLVLAQFIFGGKQSDPGASGYPLPDGDAEAVEISGGESDLLHKPSSGETVLYPRPFAADVVGITVGSGEGALKLERGVVGWDVVGAVSAPADSSKVEALLAGLLTAELRPLLESEKSDTGLDENGEGGLPIKLAVAGGGASGDFEVRVGIRPEGRYDSAYVKFPDGGVNILAADIRGELGLWKNIPDAAPDPSAWIEKDVLRFDPAEAVRIEAIYPDHKIVFERQPGQDWEQRGLVPGGEWDTQALEAWLKDLSRLRVSGIGGTGGLGKDAQKQTQARHEIKISLANGMEKTVWVEANNAGEGILAETSDFPGHLFVMPEWRFHKYFHRLSTLFPNATPRFDAADIQYIDIRQGGETVKTAYRENGWVAPASGYPLKAETVERLAKTLATWRPEDYANPDFKSIRPMFAGPMVEVILSSGRIHQYRLAGRHPLFPWRYVIVDNSAILSVTDADAGLMFPELAAVLDLGKTLPLRTPDDIQQIILEDGREHPSITIRRKHGDASGSSVEAGSGETDKAESNDASDGAGLANEWEAKTGEIWHDVHEDEITVIVRKMLDWSPAGLYGLDSRPVKPAPMHSLRVTARNGEEQVIHFLEPDERDIPYIIDGRHAYLLERKGFFNWLGVVRGLTDRINAEANEDAEQDRDEGEDVAPATKAEDSAEQDTAVPDAIGEIGERDQSQNEYAAEEETPKEIEAAEEADAPENADAENNPQPEDGIATQPDEDEADARDAVETEEGVNGDELVVQPFVSEIIELVGQIEQVGHMESPVHELQGLPEPREPDRDDGEPEVIVPSAGNPSVDNAETFERETPIHVPLTEPAHAPDSDLIVPEPLEYDGENPQTDIQVEQFVNNYISSL